MPNGQRINHALADVAAARTTAPRYGASCQLPLCKSAVILKPMSVARHLYTLPVLLIIGVGLLCAQTCSVICGFSHCAAPLPVEKVERGGKTSHCHQHQSQPKEQDQDQSQGCSGHETAITVPPSGVTSATGLHQLLPPVLAELLSSIDASFIAPTGDFARGSPFRSPPRIPLRSVLRI